MAFKLKGHELPGPNQKKSIKLNRSMDNSNLPDGRSKSSAFQKSGAPDRRTKKNERGLTENVWHDHNNSGIGYGEKDAEGNYNHTGKAKKRDEASEAKKDGAPLLGGVKGSKTTILNPKIKGTNIKTVKVKKKKVKPAITEGVETESMQSYVTRTKKARARKKALKDTGKKIVKGVKKFFSKK